MQDLADQFITAIEGGFVEGKWQRPWNSAAGVPTNPLSDNGPDKPKGHDFTGFNLLWLYMLFGGGYFATMKQWNSVNARIKKGSKSIVVLRPIFKFEKRMVNGVERKVSILIGFTPYRVFSSDDVEGWEVPEVETIEFTPIESAEALIRATGAQIEHTGSRALYIPSQDLIQSPAPEYYHSVQDYYATIMHEIIHWSGHKSRLDRFQEGSRFQHNSYAFEELIAETGATFLCARLGIEQDQFIRDNHVKYVKGWLEIMRGDSKALSQACGKAQTAANYIMAMSTAKEVEEVAVQAA